MKPGTKKAIAGVMTALILIGVLYALIVNPGYMASHPAEYKYEVDLRIWPENNVSIGYKNVSFMFYFVLKVKFSANDDDKDFRISYGDGKSFKMSETSENPNLSGHVYNASGNYMINIIGYAVSTRGKNVTASASLKVTILPFASPVLTIFTAKTIYKVNESIPIELKLFNSEPIAMNISRMNITYSTLNFWIKTPFNLSITENGQRRGLPGEIPLPPFGGYNVTVTITDDIWLFGFGDGFNFTQTGEYEIYAIYSSFWIDHMIWRGECVSNTIIFEIVE